MARPALRAHAFQRALEHLCAGYPGRGLVHPPAKGSLIPPPARARGRIFESLAQEPARALELASIHIHSAAAAFPPVYNHHTNQLLLSCSTFTPSLEYYS